MKALYSSSWAAISLMLIFINLGGCNSDTPKVKPTTANETLIEFADKQDFSGSVLVAKDNQILLNKAYGMANKANQTKNTTNTVFRLASVTKQFTSMAIMMLKAQALIDLDATLDNYIDDFPNADKITVKQLLTHTSGIVNYTSLTNFKELKTKQHSPEQLIQLFKDLPLKFSPGAEYDYSNSNYVLLGFLINRISGMSYADFINQHIFTPLTMTNSHYGQDKIGINNIAQGYSGNAQSDDISMSVPYAAGALSSTTEDMYLWHQAITNNTLLDQPNTELMFTPVLQGYALGWYETTINNQVALAHSGGIDGFSTMTIRSKSGDIVVTVLSNQESFPATEFGNQLFKKLIN